MSVFDRNGGSVFHLQKVLGHSTLEMTRRNANLVTADLQAVHEQVSLLSQS
jgi:integrase/recombinase XerD